MVKRRIKNIIFSMKRPFTFEELIKKVKSFGIEDVNLVRNTLIEMCNSNLVRCVDTLFLVDTSFAV